MPNQRYSHYTNPMLHQPGPPVSKIRSPDGVQFHQPVQTQGQYVQTEVQPDTKGLFLLENTISILLKTLRQKSDPGQNGYLMFPKV